MKKLILTLLLGFLSSSVFSQWQSSTEVDPFNGKITLVSGIGTNGDFPYENPILAFRSNGGEIDVIVSGAGSTICEEVKVSFSFGNPNEILTFRGSGNTNQDAAFLATHDKYFLKKLIDGLKKNSVVYVRFETGCSSMRFQVSLKGSSKALSTIFDNDWEDSIIQEIQDTKGDKLPKKIEELLFRADIDCNGCSSTDQFIKMKEFLINKLDVFPSTINSIDFVIKSDGIAIFVTINGVEEMYEIEK